MSDYFAERKETVMKSVEAARREIGLMLEYLDLSFDLEFEACSIPLDILEGPDAIGALVERMELALAPAVSEEIGYGSSSHPISGSFHELPAAFAAIGMIAKALCDAPPSALTPWVSCLDDTIRQLREHCAA